MQRNDIDRTVTARPAQPRQYEALARGRWRWCEGMRQGFFERQLRQQRGAVVEQPGFGVATAEPGRIGGQPGQFGDVIEVTRPSRWAIRLLQRNDIRLLALQQIGYATEIGVVGRGVHQQLIQAVTTAMGQVEGHHGQWFAGRYHAHEHHQAQTQASEAVQGVAVELG